MIQTDNLSVGGITTKVSIFYSKCFTTHKHKLGLLLKLILILSATGNSSNCKKLDQDLEK